MAEITTDNANRTAREFYSKALGSLERNSLDYAIEMFRQALAIEPNFVHARKYLRASQLKAGGGGAFKRVMSAARAAPQLTKAKMTISKNPGEAMNLVEQVLTTDPKNGQALLLLAEAADAGQYYETTVLTLEHYTKLNPRDKNALHWLARAYQSIKNFEAARDTYEQILQNHPNDFEAQKAVKDVVAHGAMQDGGWNEAGSYRDVMKDKDEAIALEQQGRVVRAEDMLDNLIRENLEKLKHDPENPVIGRELGKLYAQKGEYDTALRYLEKLFNAEGGSDSALEHEIGAVKSKRLEQGIAIKRQALADNPANSTILADEIAQLERELDLVKLREAERMVERYPNDLAYRFDLAYLLMRNDKVNEAIEQFQRSVGQPQKRIASLNYLGQCFQKLGLHDLAVEQYLKAIEENVTMDNTKKELIYNLGTAYESMGETEKAVTEYKKIAAVDFGYRDIKEKISRKPAH